MENNNIFDLYITTAEENILKLEIMKLIAVGVDGEFQILKNHVPFLTRLVPGYIYYESSEGIKDGVIVTGGIIEVQPLKVFIFADTVTRSFETDLEEVIKSRESTKKDIDSCVKEKNNVNIASLKIELLVISAKLRLLQQLNKKN